MKNYQLKINQNNNYIVKSIKNCWYWCILAIISLVSVACSGGTSSNNNPNLSTNGATLNVATNSNIDNDSGNQWAFIGGFSTVNNYGTYITKGIAGGQPGTRQYISMNNKRGSGTMWLFGGYGYAASGSAGELSDLWGYNTTNQVWTWAAGDSTVNSRSLYTADTSAHPGGRHNYASWINSDGSKLWLFGGNGYDQTDKGYLSDLWQYDVNAKQWAYVGGNQVIDQAGVYGTKGSGSVNNFPGGREGAMSWFGNDGKLWLFGGYGLVSNASGMLVEGELNDLWQYDTNTKQWTWISGSSDINQNGSYGTKGMASSSNVPGARYNGMAWVDNLGNLWLMGGEGFIGNNFGVLNDVWEFDITTKQWTWVSGSNLLAQSGNYGILGVASATNMPGSRSNALIVVESTNSILLVGGAGFANNTYGDLNDVWRYNPTQNLWTWIGGLNTINQASIGGMPGVFSSNYTPGSRDSMMGYIDQYNHVWIFGGHGYDVNAGVGYLGDLWQYIPPAEDTTKDANTWTWMSGSYALNQKWNTTNPATNTPGSSYFQMADSDKINNKLWLFGGFGTTNGDNGSLNNLWQYDLVTKQWQLVFGTSAINQLPYYVSKGTASSAADPGGRDGGNLWVDSSGKVWLFGGYYSGKYYKNDLWMYDPTSRIWTWASGSSSTNQSGVYGIKGTSSSSNIPGTRAWMTRWNDNDGNFWLFGGQGTDGTNTTGCYNDLWLYSRSSNQWTWISGTSLFNQASIYGTKGVPSVNNMPGARRDSTGWVDKSNNLWLFGGSDRNLTTFYGDLWKYNISTKEWTWMGGSNQCGVYGTLGVPSSSNTPGRRYGATSWVDNSNNLWLFGGYGCASSVYELNDLWKYDIQTGLWTWMGGSSVSGQPGIYGTLGIPSSTNIPGARYAFVGWTDSSGAFWLFGGKGYGAALSAGVGYLNDLWKYVPPAN